MGIRSGARLRLLFAAVTTRNVRLVVLATVLALIVAAIIVSVLTRDDEDLAARDICVLRGQVVVTAEVVIALDTVTASRAEVQAAVDPAIDAVDAFIAVEAGRFHAPASDYRLALIAFGNTVRHLPDETARGIAAPLLERELEDNVLPTYGALVRATEPKCGSVSGG